ncbi:MAG: deoxyribonuclease, partial [Sedimenticolaceae bacterium]
DIQLDEIFDAARQAQAEGEMADAYLLYFYAAREGHAASALALGTQADPAQRDPQDSVFDAPDIIQAHKWYQAAAQNGNAQGRERLADLRQRVEQLAADGDPQAQRISLIWQ